MGNRKIGLGAIVAICCLVVSGTMIILVIWLSEL
jgi:hypothetical protein